MLRLLYSFILLLGGIVAFAQGGLMIMPKRVLFDGTKKIQEVNLANTGSDTATYLISIVNMRMTDSGKTEFVKNADSITNSYSANEILRIYPHKVKLGPNQSQMIKLQIARYSQLPPGEYRSHIYFRSAPEEGPRGLPAYNKKDTATVSVQITAVFGFTIPVIVRVGVSDLKLNLSDVSFQKDNDDKWLNVTFNRQGNISSYGELIVNHVSVDGTESQVGLAKGLAVYTPNSKRHFKLKLNNDKDSDYRGGKLHLIYKNLEKNKSDILAEANIDILN